MTVIEEQDCPHDMTADISPAMKKYSTIPVDYDGKMYSTESLVVEDDPIVHVICTNPPIYKTKSGKEYYDNAKTKPANMETANYMLTHGYEFQITGLTDKDGNTYDWSGSLKCDLPSNKTKSHYDGELPSIPSDVKVGDIVGHTKEGNPIVYDPGKVAGHMAAMDYVEKCIKTGEKYSDGPIDYEPALGNDKKWDSCSDSTNKHHYDGKLPSITTDYETAKHQVNEYIKTLNDKKVKSMLDNDYKFVGIFNENLADRDILAVTLTLRPDVGTIDFICDMMDARLPFDLHFTQNGVVEIYYDRRD